MGGGLFDFDHIKLSLIDAALDSNSFWQYQNTPIDVPYKATSLTSTFEKYFKVSQHLSIPIPRTDSIYIEPDIDVKKNYDFSNYPLKSTTSYIVIEIYNKDETQSFTDNIIFVYRPGSGFSTLETLIGQFRLHLSEGDKAVSNEYNLLLGNFNIIYRDTRDVELVNLYIYY